MENFRLMRVATLTLFGMAVAMSNASAQNANGNPAANANTNGNGADSKPLLPPTGPRAIFNEDGTPDGDKAAGNPIDLSEQLEEDPRDKGKSKSKGKHKLTRGPVDATKSDARSGPLPEITVKR